MSFTLKEQATLNFYNWEYRGRGYYCFPKPVNIEPEYIPFGIDLLETTSKKLDDGRVTGVLTKALNLVENLFEIKETEPEPKDIELQPIELEQTEPLSLFKLNITQESKADISNIISCLSNLTYSAHPLSFEIVGTANEIVLQILCARQDEERLLTMWSAYLPQIALLKDEGFGFPFYDEPNCAIADFGLSEEFMRPIARENNYDLDPYTSLFATLERLQDNEVVMLQTIFKGVTTPWSNDITRSVSDGAGGSFFPESPEMLKCAEEKISSPLFSSVVRLCVVSPNKERTSYLARELAQSVNRSTSSSYNALIPLSNEGYDYDQHLFNVLKRTSNRWGMLLNAHELSTLIHIPDESIQSTKLRGDSKHSKAVPTSCTNQIYTIGENTHNGNTQKVSLNDEMRFRHMHLIGATGSGKSTMIVNTAIGDIKNGNGLLVLDPHGDLCDDILKNIPQERLDDVILIDPADSEYPMGFNLFQAKTEVEKIVLSSDLIASFQKQVSSWGDVIHSILSNAINTFLESERGGTLIELKRFLIEEKYRKDYLKSISDPSILYYWQKEFPLLKKGSLSPLLTRIDSFLRTKIVRYMIAQKEGVDFSEAMNSQKIILVKLSQGLIGEQNAYLLGSLMLSKVYQVALARQEQSKESRKPFFVVIDECQNFITPSISQILSGARKYSLGLVLAHQTLGQIKDTEVLESILSNPYIRICFRLGDEDARKMERNFSGFNSEDLMNLDVGQAIARVGKQSDDFNLKTFLPPSVEESRTNNIKQYVIANTREKYASTKKGVEELLKSMLPHLHQEPESNDVEKVKESSEIDKELIKESLRNDEENIKESEEEKIKPDSNFEEKKEEYLEQVEEEKADTEHRQIQKEVKACGQEAGFKASIEKTIPHGQRIDVLLEREDISIACEVSINTNVENEIENLRKCLPVAQTIISTSPKEEHLRKIESLAKQTFTKAQFKRMTFVPPNEICTFISSHVVPTKPKVKIVRGYRVKSVSEETDPISLKQNMKDLVKIIGNKIK